MTKLSFHFRAVAGYSGVGGWDGYALIHPNRVIFRLGCVIFVIGCGDESLALPIAELVCRAHFFLAEIHPFADGNGRTARLLMNLLLIRKGYPIAIIRNRDRDAYLDALATNAATGDFHPFEELVTEAIEESLRRAISFFD